VNSTQSPLVVQYLYVHGQDEEFFYPSARAAASAAGVARRYLECALVQAASLSLRSDMDCELALATNIADREALGRVGVELLETIESLGVEIIHTEYHHRPADNSSTYVSSRYVLDAIVEVAKRQPADRRLVLTDLDCVWVDPQQLFASIPEAPQIGCIHIDYPTDWDVVGFGDEHRTRGKLAELTELLGGPAAATFEKGVPWVGGELLAGSAEALTELVGKCDELDASLKAEGRVLPTEEQILTLAGALGRMDFENLSKAAWRLQTGPRHKAPPVADPLSLGLWHLPSEKGLSLRRAAAQLRRGRTAPLRRDLAEPRRLARRFNVLGTGLGRRFRDDGWIAGRRIYGALSTRIGVLPPAA
jgi:hypothetical protein